MIALFPSAAEARPARASSVTRCSDPSGSAGEVGNRPQLGAQSSDAPAAQATQTPPSPSATP